MARITVEDCFKKLGNKFELSILASYRAKEISKGAAIEIKRNNDKNSVVSLREIANEYVDISQLRQAYVQSLQLYVPSNDVVTENSDIETQNNVKEDLSPSDELIESEFISLDEEEDSLIEDLEIDPVVVDPASKEDIEEDSEEK